MEAQLEPLQNEATSGVGKTLIAEGITDRPLPH
jgi:hypothetical protein